MYARSAQEELQKLRKALHDGEECLCGAWKLRRTMQQVTTKMKHRVHAVLRSVVTKDRASEALYRRCFPNEALVEEYEHRQQQRQRDAPAG